MICNCGWPIRSAVRVTIVCPNCKQRVLVEGDGSPVLCCSDPQPTPAWVIALQSLRAPEDTGVGDTFARLLGKGGELFKATSKLLGIPCGCTARQAEWNERWPYEKTP
jgi:hypothetical protein